MLDHAPCLLPRGPVWASDVRACGRSPSSNAGNREHIQFSYGVEDVDKCCRKVLEKGDVPLPHDEETLASLVRVCIRGGNKDLANHLEGVKMRAETVVNLIRFLRESGYAGYEKGGINSEKNVHERMRNLYGRKYTPTDARAYFTPDAVKRAVDARKLKGSSIVQDKASISIDCFVRV